MLKLAELAEKRTDEFATIDTWNNGKRFSSARGDVGELVCLLKYYAGFADKIYGKGMGQCYSIQRDDLAEFGSYSHQYDKQEIRIYHA